ncbi:MAG: XTP/dITP diphosphatase [Clostridia bacterium]|nr:XTP/dITP diphosphatase [Clostridia bacterium]
MKRQIVVASNNAHKLREMSEIFTEYEVLSQKQAGFCEDVEETGTTFAENALIKARAVCTALGRITLADDSGLCVDALDGKPGVYSARYAGEHGNDKENRALLLKNMQGVTDRGAHFTCALALVTPDGQEIVVEGKTFGTILHEEQGTGGFGYDPLFFSEDLQTSFALATPQEKNAVSHRFRALQALREKCKALLD